MIASGAKQKLAPISQAISVEAFFEGFKLVSQFDRQLFAIGGVVSADRFDFIEPFVFADLEELSHVGSADIEAIGVDGRFGWHIADGSLDCFAFAGDALETHLRTRLFSPKPGHSHLPLSSLRNQLT